MPEPETENTDSRHASPQAYFHAVASERLFALYRGCSGSPQTLVILVPPFAEEMNASRRAYTALSIALSERGIASLLFDFYATGDSEGEFADSDWDRWQADLQAMIAHARTHYAPERLQLLGLRSAALLIAEFIHTQPNTDIDQILLWQPVLKGREQVEQFFRLRLAANMMLDNGQKAAQRETTQSLRELAKLEGSVDVAGYTLSRNLIQSLEQRELLSPLLQASDCPAIHWLDVSNMSAPRGERASVLQQLQQAGRQLQYCAVDGKRFWAVMEAPIPDELLQLSVALIAGENA